MLPINCQEFQDLSGALNKPDDVPVPDNEQEQELDTNLPTCQMDGDSSSTEEQEDTSERKQTSKLTLAEKLSIIRSHESPDCLYKTHESLARAFGKSRSAISKLLRPENVYKLKLMEASGVKLTVKRAVRQIPQFEVAVRTFVLGLEGKAQRRLRVQAFAKELAGRLGIDNFSGGRGWYNGFMKRHGLGVGNHEG
ncbi:hypothetical protein GUITHDRAFT_111990 [Guillardia theta CCMP2712]|uniref:HTH CENPB-type domain-containing protein n=1 Tax=Guillardia theta (strain CCMP2712) TaxID=905079 RepID=L1J144_GUITC|nr:hypothetical protein GUITHDRAFT_111990 [Guillardia theta CCMP2712]EKX41844.1 hypothetical protein GUITHDRAFT_111990 [Guillardia theta CCMP2712]|eukprot:XP_005828824.1 hypothetical protein GUITHDRAFT_111990 [Guillardia theta CCMP2712]